MFRILDEEEDADFLNGVIGELIGSSKGLLHDVFSVGSKIEFDLRGKKRNLDDLRAFLLVLKFG